MNAMQWITDRETDEAAIRARYADQPIEQWAEDDELLWGTHIVWDYTTEYSSHDPRQVRRDGWCYVLQLVNPRTGQRSYEFGPTFSHRKTAQHYGFENLRRYGVHVIPA